MPDLEHEPEPVSVEGGYQAYLDLGPTPPQALYPGGYKSIDATQKVIRNDDAQELGCAPEVSVARFDQVHIVGPSRGLPGPGPLGSS